MRVFALVNNEDYNYKGEVIHLSSGDTFYGGDTCSYPGARDYSVIRDHRRIWFAKEDVESNPQRFKELFV